MTINARVKVATGPAISMKLFWNLQKVSTMKKNEEPIAYYFGRICTGTWSVATLLSVTLHKMRQDVSCLQNGSLMLQIIQ